MYGLLWLVMGLAIMLFGFSQVVIPAWKDQKLFPWFRRTRTLRSKITAANTELAEEELERKMDKLNQRVDKKRKQ